MMLRLNYRHSRNGTPAQPPTTLGTTVGIQSLRANARPPGPQPRRFDMNAANSAQGTRWLAIPRHCISLRSTPEFNQTRSGYQQASDLPSNVADSSLGHSGNASPPGLQPGEFDIFPESTCPPEVNMAYPVQDLNLLSGPMPAPSMKHGLNPSISSHPVTQQHQWGTCGHFPMGDPSQNSFGAPPLFSPTGYANMVTLAHSMRQSQSPSTTGNGQSSSPAPGIQVVDGR